VIVHPPSNASPGRNERSQLGSDGLRHAGSAAYRCFLPDLTGLTVHPLRRARPSTPLTLLRPRTTRPRAGIRPRY